MKKLLLAMINLLCAGMATAANYDSKWTVPPDNQVTVTASDVTTYEPPLVSMWVGTTGTLRLILSRDSGIDCTDAPVHTAVPVGLFRGRIFQVCATGTDAGAFVGYPSDSRR